MKALELDKKYKTILDKSGINTPLRKAHFWAQLDHESGLKPISENLNYSASGLFKTFPRHFTRIEAKEYERKPERIANRAYGNRMGNGNEASGDGWKYRGRGFIQLTGKNNYAAFAKDSGIDALNNPDLLLQEVNALVAALWFWDKNRLNRFSDKDDVRGLTRAINGGSNGLAHRQQLTTKYKTRFK